MEVPKHFFHGECRLDSIRDLAADRKRAFIPKVECFLTPAGSVGADCWWVTTPALIEMLLQVRARISRTQRPLVNRVPLSASWSVFFSPLGWVIVCVFFEPPGADGFVNRVGPHAKFRADGWNFHSHVEPVLDFLKALLRELVTLPGHR